MYEFTRLFRKNPLQIAEDMIKCKKGTSQTRTDESYMAVKYSIPLSQIVDEFSFDESRHYTRKVAEHALRFAYMYATSVEEWREMVDALFPVVVPEIEARDDWGI